jgi:hypothetical protein
MNGTKGLEPFDVIVIIDRLKGLFRSPEEQDFLNSLKDEIVSGSDSFNVKQFSNRIQKQSEILHELARTIRWGEQQRHSDDYQFHE